MPNWEYGSTVEFINFSWLKFRQYPSPITLYPTAPLYNIIIIFDTVLRQKRMCKRETWDNEFNSAAISRIWHPQAMLCGVQINVAGNTATVGNVKIAVWKDRIIVASTCRRSVQFGCFITWPWMANCVSVMIKMLPLFNFTISCHDRLAWKTSQCAWALGGSRFWLVESTLFGDHVSLRLHREFSLKFNLSNELPGIH